MALAGRVCNRIAFCWRAKRSEHKLLQNAVSRKWRSSALANVADHESAGKHLGTRYGGHEKSEEKSAAHAAILNHARRRRYNTAVKSSAWVAALVLSAILHGLIIVPAAPGIGHSVAAARFDATALQILKVSSIAWCVIVSVWCALVTKTLANPGNRWGGISGLRLFGTVVGLTAALDAVSTPCLFTCPPLLLIPSILSYVAINNVSAPLEDTKSDN